MSELPPLSRVIAGHNAAGLGTIQQVDLITPEPALKFPGAKARTIWTTTSVPAKDNNDETDGATRPVTGDLGIVAPGATYCGVTDLAPGATASWHRTASVDHNILISGKVILMMEDGTELLIDQPGSVVVQKGAMHAWRNPGPEWARWVCVLIDAEPAVANGQGLKSGLRETV